MQGLVLDFDGVIVDSEPVHEAALRLAALDLGLDFSHEEYTSRYIGFDDRDFLTALAGDHGRRVGPGEVELFNRQKRDAFMRVVKDGGVRAFPGAIELIRAAARCPLAVCSGARRHEIEPILEALGVLGSFGVIVSADDVHKSKPDPACYALTARKLGIEPGLLVAVEDTSFGIESALGAGYRVAAVAHSMPESELRRAHRVFKGIDEITVEVLAGM